MVVVEMTAMEADVMEDTVVEIVDQGEGPASVTEEALVLEVMVVTVEAAVWGEAAAVIQAVVEGEEASLAPGLVGSIKLQ